MKIIVYMLTFFAFGIVNAQKIQVFIIDDVEVEFNITIENDLIKEIVKITNFSDETIYIPKTPELIDRYFFNLKGGLFSYSGVKNSMTGGLNLEGRVDLVKLNSGKSISHTVQVAPDGHDIEEYYFSFDFIKEDAHKLLKKKSSNYILDATDYYKLCSTFYSKG